jgi:isoquinoline 1-oxidoreductase beta subunit
MKVSRRTFLATSAAAATGGALVVGLRLHGPFQLAHRQNAEKDRFDTWIRIHPDDKIELVLAKTEMGQGLFTALPMVLAEEAELDWSKVTVVQAEQSGGTGGSGSVKGSYLPLRQAGAQVREVMILAAARRWNVPKEECLARNSHIFHRGTGRVISYGSLVEHARRLSLPDAKTIQLKDPKAFTLLGRALPHLDIPDKTMGRARFGLDVRPEGMVYAVVTRSPKLGGTLLDFDASQAMKVRGVLQVFEIKTRDSIRQVAVVAKTTWAAIQGRSALKVRWNSPSAQVESSETLAARYRTSFDKSPEWTWDTPHQQKPHARPAKRIESVYEYPFLAHAPIEPMNTTAHLQGDRLEVWAPSQDGNGVRKNVAMELGLPETNVKVHVTFVGGGFGSRFNKAYAVQAVQIAKQTHTPVQLVWTREDTMANGEFRQFGAQRLRGAVDTKGNIVSWDCHIVDTSVTGPWGMPPHEWEAPSLHPFLYPVHDLHYTYTQIPSPVKRGAWRSVSESFNGFVVESFIDELAHAAEADPYEFRRRLLVSRHSYPNEPSNTEAGKATPQAQAASLLAVLDEVAARANWHSPLGKGRGKGIACWQAYGSFVAQVAEVTTERDSFHVDRIVTVVDCGQVLNANGVKAQIEGGSMFGLSAAMREAITIKDGAVQEQNFNSYQVARMPDSPVFETYLVESHREPGGLGELGVTLAAPIVANAVFAATGKRLKRLPFKLDEVSL